MQTSENRTSEVSVRDDVNLAREFLLAMAGIQDAVSAPLAPPLGLTEAALDDAIRMLYSDPDMVDPEIEMRTPFASVKMQTQVSASLAEVWPMWAILKARVKQTPARTPVLILVDKPMRDALSVLAAVVLSWGRAADRGSIALIHSINSKGNDCVVRVSDAFQLALTQRG